MIPEYARYRYCINKSIEFIMNENLKFFPYDCDIIIKNHKWSRFKYSELAKKCNTSIVDIAEAYDSEDGYSIFNGRNYSIAYNDTQIPNRIYFTKLHEIGHIFLNHFVDFNETLLLRSTLNKNSYKVLENEANCFARNVICPAVLVEFMNLNTPKKIKDCFGITLQAAKTRLDLLDRDLKYINKESKIRQLTFFNDFIYKKVCPRCNYGLISKASKFCTICGGILIRGDGTMIYDGYTLDTKGRAVECPTCKNEQMATDGVYCKICGTYLINKCTNDDGIYEQNECGAWIEVKPKCGMITNGNSRFCEYCGEPTTFYKQGLLTDWQTNKTLQKLTKDTMEQAAADINNDNIPF